MIILRCCKAKNIDEYGNSDVQKDPSQLFGKHTNAFSIFDKNNFMFYDKYANENSEGPQQTLAKPKGFQKISVLMNQELLPIICHLSDNMFANSRPIIQGF